MHPLAETKSSSSKTYHSVVYITLSEFEARNKEVVNEFKKYVDLNGFPFKNKENYEVYKAGVALSLHADFDFLKNIEGIFKNANISEIDQDHLAYFVDKIRVYENKPQLYGTQFKRLPDNSIEFLPIEDEKNVDNRRAEIGLITLNQYKKFAES